MTRFNRLLEAFDSVQKARADRVIQQHSHLGAKVPEDQGIRKMAEGDKPAAAAPYQPSLVAGDVAMKPISPEIGDVTMPLHCFEKHDYHHSGVVVIASAWLVLYGLVFSGFAFTPAAEAFASLY